jgi:hypothetical protein
MSFASDCGFEKLDLPRLVNLSLAGVANLPESNGTGYPLDSGDPNL